MGTSLSILKLRSRASEEEEKERLMLGNGGMLLEELLHSCDGKYNPFRIFSVEELAKATNNYSEPFANGGLFQIKRGFFNGRPICVKSFHYDVNSAINEVVFASQVNNHKNILMLLGCCLETVAPKLVYEYAEKGVLSDHIFKSSTAESNNHHEHQLLLNWDCRLKVAKEIADALAYLHTGLSIPIIHRNVKPINIFLDENYIAKLSDFSMSVSIPSGEEYVERDDISQGYFEYMEQGTFEYMAPEYYHTSRITEKCDVYSFGSLLIEILSGGGISYLDLEIQVESILASCGCGACNFVEGVVARYNPDFITSNQRATTSSSVQSSAFNLGEGKPHLHEFIFETAKKYMGPDIMLEDQWKLSMAWSLASKCHSYTPEERPTMKEVAQEIRRIIRFQCNTPSIPPTSQ